MSAAGWPAGLDRGLWNAVSSPVASLLGLTLAGMAEDVRGGGTDGAHPGRAALARIALVAAVQIQVHVVEGPTCTGPTCTGPARAGLACVGRTARPTTGTATTGRFLPVVGSGTATGSEVAT